MKLSPESLAFILNAVKTAGLVGIDSIIIEPTVVRAMDDARTVVILQKDNIPQFEFSSIGISRLDVLMARYEIARTTDNFAVEFTNKDDGGNGYVGSLVMKGKGTKIEYKCGDPTKINAPMQVNDIARFEVSLTREAVTLLQKGTAAMKTDVVSIISDNGVSFELVDVNNDIFKHQFADDASFIPDEDGNVVSSTKFAHRYPVRTLLALFRDNPDGSFTISQKGILSFSINGLTVYVLPNH